MPQSEQPKIVRDGDRIVREPEEKRLTGLSRTTRYRLERNGDFPKSVPLGKKSRGRWYSELMEWLDSRREN